RETAETGRQRRLDDALHQPLVASPIGDEVGDRDQAQPVLAAVVDKVGRARHRAVVVLDLADYPGGDATGQARQVHGRLGVTDALQDTAVLRLHRLDMATDDDVASTLRGVDGHAHRLRLIVDADARGNTLAGFDRYGERGLVRSLVVRRHELEP